MTQGKTLALITALIIVVGLSLMQVKSPTPSEATTTTINPALSVATVRPDTRDLPVTLAANGSIAAWQEAVIGAEIGDLRLSAVNVQVGESVKQGQVLATFNDESVQADIAHSRAIVAEAEANLAEAQTDADRATRISGAGALSAQQVDQFLTKARTAAARLQSAKAQLDGQRLRLKYTHVIASDDGVISSRSATLGAVANKGEELFRLIRQNRLEWRADVTADEMPRLKPDIEVWVSVPDVGQISGRVRMLAPTIDPQSRNGVVYVDVPNAAQQGFRAGMFARGEFRLSSSPALTVPQEALTLREGFSYVFRLKQQQTDLASVEQIKVQLGRHAGDRVEVLSGLTADDVLVASGASFLTDGDNVRVVAP
ncbi:MAG: efflux RND transporter periplasmic adaptor subunit [Methylomonas sp.]|nr:efflux RND transporter periplasmic adaptor subunit [Methylomonas sp.]PPD21823.1 MAG: efflux transporter periplasmic adaptor subunit [Methylomonas sp.]PPD27109.1 MAG: efflux transporter periplasmic adaptor subunit [Methylomonas sp.]PPD39063.1 MAG: efflux transporter periplasmic adaptor subunit [Methylomonas sp.]PPD42290.1 MAG: efflux transporter periplasmic adaptor subunit [Methylomonas sp.]